MTFKDNSLVAVSRPKPLYLWLGRACLVFTPLYFFYLGYLVLQGESSRIDINQVPFFVMAFITGIAAGLYKKEVIFDKENKSITVRYSVVLPLYKKIFAFKDYVSVWIKEDVAKTQGADLSRQATHSSGVMLYYVLLKPSKKSVDTKDLEVKKFFEKAPAEELVREISSYTGLQ